MHCCRMPPLSRQTIPKSEYIDAETPKKNRKSERTLPPPPSAGMLKVRNKTYLQGIITQSIRSFERRSKLPHPLEISRAHSHIDT